MTNAPDGSFIPPPPGSAGSSDVGALLRNTLYQIDAEPAAQNQPLILDLARLTGNRDYAGISYVRVPLNDNRGGHAQTGAYSKVNTKRASGALIVDDPGYLRLPFLTTALQTAAPGTADRLTSATVFATHVFVTLEPGAAVGNLFKETSQTDPTPIAVAGFPGIVPAGAVGIMCIERIVVGGVEYLAVGYGGAPANSLQVLSNLNNPPTNSFVPVGATPTWGVIQTAIDGNALLVYQGSLGGVGTLKAIRTDVAIGSAAVSATRSTLNPGGYAVGMSGWESDAYCYFVEPLNGQLLGYNSLGANRGRLLRTDMRGYSMSPVDVPLPWVSHVTRVRGGFVVCDTTTHWFMSKKGYQHEFRRMTVFDDVTANSNRTLVCCGHHENAGRFMIEANDTIATGGTGNTQRYWIEWDFDQWAPTQVSTAKTLSTTGVLSIGGAKAPWSPFTNFLHARADGSWYRQFQPPLGSNGYNLRHTTGAAAGTGPQTESTETLTWPVMDIDGLEDQVKIIFGVIGPKPGNVAQGGADATVLVEELLSGLTGNPTVAGGRGALFNATEPTERIPLRRFKDRSWTYQIQPRVTLTRSTTASDATRLNLNGFGNGIYLELLSVKNPIMAPSAAVLKALDALKV